MQILTRNRGVLDFTTVLIFFLAVPKEVSFQKSLNELLRVIKVTSQL